MTTATSESNESVKANNGVVTGPGPRKASSLLHTLKRELYQLAHPYYIINLILGTSFLFLRLVPPICHYVFGKSGGKIEFGLLAYKFRGS